MANIGTKFVALGLGVPLSLVGCVFALAQSPAPNAAPNVPSNNMQTVIPQPEAPVVNQDVPMPMAGQTPSVPLHNPKPMSITNPADLEKAMGIEVPDILKPTPTPSAVPSTTPQPAIPARPSRPPTPQEIAREIAPNFDVATDYNRLTQCYGTADFMSAFMRVRASRPGAAPQLRAVAGQIAGMKAQMQPFVLAASTVRTETRFRTDYDRVARGISTQISRARNPDPIIQTQLRTLDACSRDLNKWRGAR